jgi:lysylphosphatidylglycerol synthetase-like protein (DUF2156 family)
MIARAEHHLVLMQMALVALMCVLLVSATLIVAALMGPPSVPNSLEPNAAPSHSNIVQTMQY